MLVEGGEQLEAGRAVVKLVKHPPETIGVPQSVPPIKNEGAAKPISQPLGGGCVPAPHVPQRILPKIAVPGKTVQTSKQYLATISG